MKQVRAMSIDLLAMFIRFMKVMFIILVTALFVLMLAGFTQGYMATDTSKFSKYELLEFEYMLYFYKLCFVVAWYKIVAL